MKFKTDPTYPDCVRVPVLPQREGFPKINPNILPGTVFRWNPKTKKVIGFFTQTGKDGTGVGWNYCGTCGNYFEMCKCLTGVHHTRAIAYCMFSSVDGVEPGRPVMAEDYAKYFDPYGKRDAAGNLKPVPKSDYVPYGQRTKQSVDSAPAVPVKRALKVARQDGKVRAVKRTVQDVADATAVDAVAKATAAKATRKLRASVLKGK